MTNYLFYAFFVSLIIGTTLTPILILVANQIGLLDKPNKRKMHKEPIARAGGIAFAIGAILAILLWAPQNAFIIGAMIGMVLILCIGTLDDFFDLPAKTKLYGQIMAASITATYGQLTWQPLSSLMNIELPHWIAVFIIITLLVMVTNAINFSDGLDGLAGGLSFLSFGTIAYLAYQTNDTTVMYLTLPVMGGLLGFLRFNTYPARVFMGDGGSQFLGFLLAVVALLITDSERAPFSPFLMVFFVGIPLLDLMAVTTQRLLEKGSPFLADTQHLHHKLLTIGFSHHQVVLIIYTLQILMMLMGYSLRWETDGLLIGVYLGLLGCIGAFFYFVSSERLPPDVFRAQSAGIFYWRTWLRSVPWLSITCVRSLGIGLLGFFLFALSIATHISQELGISAIGVALLIGVGLFGSPKTILTVTRMGLYLGSTFTLYLIHDYLSHQEWTWQIVMIVYFSMLVILLMLAIHLDEQKQFQVNPMDYLLLFLALLIPFFPEIQVSGINLGLLMARLIILFFCCEIVLQAFSAKTRQLAYISGMVLLGIGIQGLL